MQIKSITIDPQYDTSAVLLGYAKIWNAAAEGWRFLTGPDREIEIVARRFGMNYWPEEGLITHTSETGIIARDGRLAAAGSDAWPIVTITPGTTPLATLTSTICTCAED